MKYYTLEEAAEIHRVSIPTERNWLKEGRYPHAKKNGKWTIPQCCMDGHSQEEIKKGGTGNMGVNEELVAETKERDLLVIRKEKLTLQKDVDALEAERGGGIIIPEQVAAFNEAEAKQDARDISITAREKAVDNAIRSVKEAKQDIQTVSHKIELVKNWCYTTVSVLQGNPEWASVFNADDSQIPDWPRGIDPEEVTEWGRGITTQPVKTNSDPEFDDSEDDDDE